MSFQKIFQKIGIFFHGIFDSADRAIKKLSPELLKAFSIGSGIIDQINTSLDSTPSEILTAIHEKFPGFDPDKIHGALGKVTEGLNIAGDIADSADTNELVATIQNYLKEKKGKDGSTWAKLSSVASKIIGHFFAPEGTKSNVFELLMETFYHLYVKK